MENSGYKIGETVWADIPNRYSGNAEVLDILNDGSIVEVKLPDAWVFQRERCESVPTKEHVIAFAEYGRMDHKSLIPWLCGIFELPTNMIRKI